jgi:cell wall-associated NlpC family hydrolase
LACLTVALAAAATATAQSRAMKSSWADREIRFVVAHGLMARDVSTFRPDKPLTKGALASLVAGLGRTPASFTPDAPDATPVTMAQLDARIVKGLGYGATATAFANGARAAGLTPPSRFGTEVVARLIGLRVNHPAAQDSLELGPNDPATRAEAAYSAAAALRLEDWNTDALDEEASTFTLPELTPWQAEVLQTAVKLIGYPYVWAGTSELPQSPTGKTVPGGFDCSGFVWRVFKLQAYDGGETLADTLKGRTAAEMAGEVGRAKRVSYAKLQPGDIMFFATSGSLTKAASVDHTGIYLGNGWMIHSSRYGVAVVPVTSGWYRDRFAWGRRPLAEAGLS